MRLLGWDLKAYVRGFRRLNLVERHPGKRPGAGKGDAFPMPLAEAAARRLLPNLAGRRVVALGAGVVEALVADALHDWAWCSPLPVHGFTLLPLPHPSGRNRWWNSPDNVRAAQAALRSFCDLRSVA